VLVARPGGQLDPSDAIAEEADMARPRHTWRPVAVIIGAALIAQERALLYVLLEVAVCIGDVGPPQ